MTAGVVPGEMECGTQQPPSPQYPGGFSSVHPRAATAEGSTYTPQDHNSSINGGEADCCNLLDAHLLRMFRAGQSYSIQLLTPPNVTESELQVLLVHVAGNGAQMAVPVKVEHQSPGTFYLHVQVEHAGNYAFDIAVPEVVEIGKPAQFHVDASRAGEGQLEISVNHGEVPNQVEVLSSGKCIISFVPEKPVNHVVEIKFNGVLVPSCPLKIRAEASRSARGVMKVGSSDGRTGDYRVDLSHLELVPADEPVSFSVRIPGGRRELIRVSILSPSRNSVPVSLKATGHEADVVTVEFTPKQVGVHVISVEYNGQSLEGAPANVRCFDARLVQVIRAPGGSVGETVEF
ncbi:filamin-A-like, partial [Tropilaelaps mercedesae]